MQKVRYGKKRARVTPATHVKGFVCKSIDGSFFFRVYKAKGAFTDYDIRHDDLEVTIAPGAMASFYSIGENRILDHSPEVLGLRIRR